ncbi:ABC transporter permease [Microbacterium sp. LWS13-1.2]|uniref:ABC transporter permease n=1 Tax=Microbacterium sp. LWS13-1.2 TaxID=3135264 RepID=A0AAU6S8M7_9MICO
MTIHVDERPLAPARAPLISRLLRATGPSTGAIAGIVVLCIALGFTQPIFFTVGNFTNLISANSAVLILAVGTTFVLLSGGLDLSVVAAGAASGVAFCLMLQSGFDALPAVLATLIIGCLFGALNGVLINFGRIPFLVVTLGTASVFASLALVVSDGKTINVFDIAGFQPIYSFMLGSALGVPLLLVLDVILVVAAVLVLKFTIFGRAVFAIGSNREAARLNGINVQMTSLLVYLISGLSAALASLIQVGRLTGAAPTFDGTLLLTVLAAVLIGGTAYSGGEGGVLGTVIGVFFLGIIQNGLTLTNVSSFWRGAVNGAVLILAVALGVARDRGVFRRKKLSSA